MSSRKRRARSIRVAGSDFSKAFVSLVETGRVRASLRAARIFADRLGVAVSEVVDPTPALAEAEKLRKALEEELSNRS